jgi:ankyrin repeat protein
MLLENGGDRTVKTADGETPYDLALQNGHAECAMFLRLNSDDDGFAGETIRSTVI